MKKNIDASNDFNGFLAMLLLVVLGKRSNEVLYLKRNDVDFNQIWKAVQTDHLI